MATLTGLKSPSRSALDPRVYYKYSKLEKGQIRLLNIHLDSSSWPQYTLVNVSLDRTPQFEAISYTWGDQTAIKHIMINKKPFRTTKTVADIIRGCCHRLGKLLTDDRRIMIWIDSICINQSDTEEKNHQIPMMREIYSGAQRTVVCLGDSEDSELAVAKLLELRSAGEYMGRSDLYAKLSELNDSSGWCALSKLIAHPWFSRVWIVQEVATSREVFVSYGHELLTWDDVYEAIMIYIANGGNSLVMNTPSNMIPGIQSTIGNISNIAEAREAVQRGESWNLEEGLMSSCEFKATDPRDKVFALLGLVSTDLDLSVFINYNSVPSQIFLQTARYILSQSTSTLAILSLAGTGNERALSDLPSWVPDWSHIPTRQTLSLAPSTLPTRYEACGPLSQPHIPSYLVSNDDQSILTLTGQVVESLHIIEPIQVENVFTNATTPIDFLRHVSLVPSLYHACQDLCITHVPDPYPIHPPQPRSEALWRALIGDRTVESRPAPPDFEDYFVAAQELILSPRTWPDRDVAKQQLMETYVFLMAVMASGRKFAISKKGFMGWVPPLAKPGDLVCVMGDAETPYVLRKRKIERMRDESDGSVDRIDMEEEGGYEFVGECYFHGMMDGEMLDPTRELEVFNIH